MDAGELYFARATGRSVLDRFGTPGRWASLTVAVASLACAALVVEGTAPAAAAAPVRVVAAPQAPVGPDLSGPATAPDGVSAMVQARAQDRAVEDLSQRTVESSTFALPDGSWATGVGSGPVWVPRTEDTGGDGTAAEDWERVDLTLEVDEDGLVRPRAQVADLVLSGGETSPEGPHAGHTVVAAVTDPDTGVVTTSGWEGALPEPLLQGRRAVYEEVRPGVDLVVEATSTGFEEFFILDDPAAADELTGAGLSLAAQAADRTEGAGIEELADETLAVMARDGQVAATSGTPLMWDNEADEAREHPLTAPREAEPAGGRVLSPMPDWDHPDRPAPTGAPAPASGPDPAGPGVDAELVADPLAQSAPVAREVAVAGGVAEVSLVPDEEFLTDPGTQFPVVVDPSVSIRVGFDTYVQSGYTGDASAATELRLGTFDGGTSVARSFLQFATTAIAGKVVTAARLDLFAFHSYSCTARNWQVWHTFSASTATRWTAQPSWRSLQATTSATAGYSASCPDAWANVDVKNIVAAGAANSDAQLTLGLRAENEADTYGWKRFYSAENGANIPSLWVTYNSYPNTPSGAAHASSTEYYKGVDPVTGAATLYVTTPRPSFSAIVSDPDGGTVRGAFDILLGSTTVWNKLLGTSVASGGRSAFTPISGTPALADGKTYTARVWGNDGSLTSKSSGPSWTFTTDLTKPATPTVTSQQYKNGQWEEQTPATATFTFSSSSTDVTGFRVYKDGSSTPSAPVQAVTEGAVRTAQLVWAAPAGSHSLRVEAIDKAGQPSPATTFTFGSGGAALTSPAAGAKSTDTFQVTASAPPDSTDTVTPAIYWRPAGTASPTGWNPTTGTTTGWTLATTLPAVPAGKPVNVTGTFAAAAAATTMGQARTPALIDVQVCFTYKATGATRCTWVSENQDHPSHTSVLRVPHAFGDAFPEADAGPGKVALWTGEFSTAATDISVPTPKDTLSISRTYASFAGPPASPAAGVLGPGWVANLDGSDFGAAGYQVADSTGVDGTIALIDGDGQALVYRQPGGGKIQRKDGVYTPVDEDTAAEGARLELKGTRLTLTEEDGTITAWTVAAGAWTVETVQQAGQVGTTTFARDGQGRITQILAPAPDGVACPTTTTEVLIPGCRALRLQYATATTATANTPGDYAGRLTRVTYHAHNPDKAGGAGMDAVDVAAYAYTTTGYLAQVTDPRTNLTTRYTYGPVPSGLAAPQLATITPPGLATWHLTYDTTSQGTHGLTQVARDPATGTGTPVVQAGFVYGLTPAGTAGLPTLDAETVATWGQATAPTWGAAVFDAAHPVTTPDPAKITTADWAHADLQYTDPQGRVVNTAAHGAGTWQVTATGYDTGGRVVRTLDQHAIAQIRDQVAAGASVDPDTYATITRYNADITAPTTITYKDGETTKEIKAGEVLTPAGTYVTDVWEPASPAGPSGELVRVHTRTEYDQGAPNHGVSTTTGVPYRLPTTVTTTVAAPGSGSPDPGDPVPAGEEITSLTRTGYDPIDGTEPSGDTSGWTLGLATSTTTVMGPGQSDITTRTAYNAAGQAVQTRQPKSTGADAGTTTTLYYTALAHPTDPACGNQSAQAGLPCATRTGEITPTVATTRTQSYDRYGSPRVVTETLGTVTRTTTTTYTPGGQVDTVTTTTGGLSGSTALPATRTTYSPTTGLPTTTIALTGGVETGRITTGYDSWGRVVAYTDTDGQTTTTSYTQGGQVHTVTDPTGTSTFTYDGTDAKGTEEHRGLPTAMTVTNADQPTLRLGAAYDEGGNLALQTLPGGIHQTYAYDRSGQVTDLIYSGDSPTGRFDWYAFTLTRDADGDITADTAPGRTRSFTNDRADRLTHVTDTITNPADATSTCTTRTYTFDPNGNRTSTATTTGAPDQPCTTTGATTRTWTHDTADRVTTGANTTGTYTYDPLGRQTTIPATDTPNGPGAGDLTIGYYDTDLVRATTQNGTTTTYQLDPAQRRSTTTTQTGESTTTTTRHYADTTDNPAWATATKAEGTTTTSRYVSGLAGGLTLEITDTTPAITVTDPHGTTATTIPVPATTTHASTSTGWQRTDEYGNRLVPEHAQLSSVLTYGWHGKEERAADITGLILMGVRLYNAVTGLFTSRDPIPGGNTTSYTYPQDPMNNHDLDGKARKKSWLGSNWRTVAAGGAALACVFTGLVACVAIGLATAFATNWSHNRRRGWSFNPRGFARDAALVATGAGAARLVGGSWRAAARTPLVGRLTGRHSAAAGRHAVGTARTAWRTTGRNLRNNATISGGGFAASMATNYVVRKNGWR